MGMAEEMSLVGGCGLGLDQAENALRSKESREVNSLALENLVHTYGTSGVFQLLSC